MEVRVVEYPRRLVILYLFTFNVILYLFIVTNLEKLKLYHRCILHLFPVTVIYHVDSESLSSII